MGSTSIFGGCSSAVSPAQAAPFLIILFAITVITIVTRRSRRK